MPRVVQLKLIKTVRVLVLNKDTICMIQTVDKQTSLSCCLWLDLILTDSNNKLAAEE